MRRHPLPRPEDLLPLLALLLALLWLLQGVRPIRLHVTHAAFHHAWCACPLCVIRDTMIEVSWSEYC